MSKKNGKKLLIAVAVGAVVVKAVRDVIKAKKQEEELRSALDDFYEEELTGGTGSLRKERNCKYGNENTAPQAVGSTLNPIGADKEGGTPCRRKQHRKRLLLQSRLPS